MTYEQMIAAYLAGKSSVQIAAATGLHRASVTRILRRHGVTMRPSGRRARGPQWTDEQVIAARRAGNAIDAIAFEAHMGTARVKAVLVAAGLYRSARLTPGEVERLRASVRPSTWAGGHDRNAA